MKYTFRSSFGQWSFQKNAFEIYWPLAHISKSKKKKNLTYFRWRIPKFWVNKQCVQNWCPTANLRLKSLEFMRDSQKSSAMPLSSTTYILPSTIEVSLMKFVLKVLKKIHTFSFLQNYASTCYLFRTTRSEVLGY